MMRLQRSTLALLALALVMGGVVYTIERLRPPDPVTSSSQAAPIFGFQEEEIQGLTIRLPDQTLVLVKDGPKSTWQLQAPVKGPASEASVAYLANLLATGQSSSRVTTGGDRLQDFGLDVPLARIEVKLANGRSHRLVLGQPNFNRSALYAQADPEAGPEQTVLLVPLEFENAVKRPLAEWQQTAAAGPAPGATPKTNATVRPNQR